MIISSLLIVCLLGITLYGYRYLARGNFVIGPMVISLAFFGIFLVVKPEYSTKIANHLGVGRGADLLIYLLFTLSIAMILLIHAKFRKTDILITNLARSIALANPKFKETPKDLREYIKK
jgi:hypothetical protein